MSQSDDFDADIEQSAGQDMEQQDQTPDREINKPKSNMLFKVVIILAVIGGAGFYFLKSSAIKNTAYIGLNPVQQNAAIGAAHPVAPLPAPPDANVMAPVAPSEKPPENMPANGNIQPPISGEIATISPPAGQGSEDPLAWNPGASPQAVPAAPVVAPPAEQAPVMPSGAVPVVDSAAIGSQPPEQPALTAEKTEELEKRIAALEKVVMDFQAKAATKADLESLEVAIGKLQQTADQVRNPAKAKTGNTKTAVGRHKAQPVTVPVSSSWILKSAKPGMAWVAQTGSSELRVVSVGETLPGIGRITAIVKDSSGHWIVSGSKGMISQ